LLMKMKKTKRLELNGDATRRSGGEKSASVKMKASTKRILN